MVTWWLARKPRTVSAFAEAHSVINSPKAKAERILRQSLLNEPRQCAHERPRIQGVDGFTTDNIGGIKARCGCEAMSLMSCRFRLWLAPN
jgi:hypothetical protein